MATVTTPTNLRSWVGESDNTRVFAWTLVFDSHGDPDEYDYELQLDSQSDFQSINCLTYTKTTCSDYQDGNVVKAFEIPIARRSYDGELTFYWRVRINGGGFVGRFTPRSDR